MNRRELISSTLALLGIGGAVAVAEKDEPRNGQGYTEAELDAMPEVWIQGRFSRRWFNEQASAWAAIEGAMVAFIGHAPDFMVGPIKSHLWYRNTDYKYTIHVPQEWYDALWDEARRGTHGGLNMYAVRPRELWWRAKVEICPPPRFDKDECMTKDGRIFYVSLVREDRNSE